MLPWLVYKDKAVGLVHTTISSTTTVMTQNSPFTTSSKHPCTSPVQVRSTQLLVASNLAFVSVIPHIYFILSLERITFYETL